MSKSEIQSWLSSASTSDDVEFNGNRPSWQRDRVLNDWQKSMGYAQGVLLHDKTKLRVQFLQDELLSLAKHGGTSVLTSCPERLTQRSISRLDTIPDS